MATPAATAAEIATSAQTAVNNSNAMILNLWGYQLNLMSVLILGLIFGLFYLFYSIQKSQRLDFADMFTKDGRKVSSTKVLQFIAGIASTWFIIKTGLQGTLSAELFLIYLAFMASVEGFSKFVSAKYNYSETSVRDASDNKLEATRQTNIADAAAEAGGTSIDPLKVDGDGPVEASVTQTTTPDGQTVVEKKIKKG